MTNPRLVVGAAILRGHGGAVEVLAAQRLAPPELAGRWEFVGGKVDAGESDHQALQRECFEEIGVELAVGDRIGADVGIGSNGFVLRVWLARITRGQPSPTEHSELRWLSPSTLYDVDWLPADLPIVAALHALWRAGDVVESPVPSS